MPDTSPTFDLAALKAACPYCCPVMEAEQADRDRYRDALVKVRERCAPDPDEKPGRWLGNYGERNRGVDAERAAIAAIVEGALREGLTGPSAID